MPNTTPETKEIYSYKPPTGNQKVAFLNFVGRTSCRLYPSEWPGVEFTPGDSQECEIEERPALNGDGTNPWLKRWGTHTAKVQDKKSGGGYTRTVPTRSNEEIRSDAFRSIFHSILQANTPQDCITDEDFKAVESQTQRALKLHDQYVFRGTQPVGAHSGAQTSRSAPQATTSASGPSGSQPSAPAEERIANLKPPTTAFGYKPDRWPGPNKWGTDETDSQRALIKANAQKRGYSDSDIPLIRTAVLAAYGYGDEGKMANADLLIAFLMYASETQILDASAAALDLRNLAKAEETRTA